MQSWKMNKNDRVPATAALVEESSLGNGYLMTDNAGIIRGEQRLPIDPDVNIVTRDCINRLNNRTYTAHTNWPRSTFHRNPA